MNRPLLALAACGSSGCGSSSPTPASPGASDATVYVNVLVLVLGGGARSALRVEGGRITHVLDADDPSLDGARVDLGSATIVPGLVDAHLHLRELRIVGTVVDGALRRVR